jgi:PAS domain S-box-containing protein
MSEIDNSSDAKSFPPDYPPLDEGFLNALFNALTEAVLATNLDTTMIAYWNRGAESMFGYSAQEVLGRTTEFLYPDVASFRRIHEIAAPVIREQGYWRAEWEFRHRNGSLFPAEATAVPFLQAAGETFIVYVIRDITERRRAEE